MSTIHTASMGIALGFSDIAISCGVEHMTHVPMGGPGGGDPAMSPVRPNEKLYMDPRFQKYEYLTAVNMGLTAEKLLTQTTFSREDMDRWAARSHQRAAKALEEGYFKGEIMPVEVTLADGSKQVIDHGPPRQATGCGIHFAVADVTGTGTLDIVAPGKDGLYLFENLGEE